MPHTPRNYGLIIEPLKETDYIFGGTSKLSGEVINPNGDWLPYIPQFEHQAPGFETSSCVTHGTLNAFEGLNKLIFGTEPNLSDRFVAKTSGTDPKQGNSPQKVAEAFRKHWSVFEEEYPRDVKSAEEFYKDIPDLLYSKAQIVKGKDVFGYEAIQNPTKIKLQEALTKGAVGMSVFAWTQDDNDLYFKPEGFTDNHWVWLVQIKQNGNYIVFDSYSPSLKEIRADFIPQVAYRYTLNEEKIDSIIAAIRAAAVGLANYVASLLKPTPKPEPKPLPPHVPQADRYTIWAQAIQAEESSKPPRPTDVNVRLKNPGNLKYTSYTASLGGKKSTVPGLDGGTFCEFDTYQDGLNALKQFLKDAVDGKLRAYKPTQTLLSFTKVYANPPNDGYATNVAKKLGKTIQTPIKDLI